MTYRRGTVLRSAASAVVLCLFLPFSASANSTPRVSNGVPSLGINVVVANQHWFTTPQVLEKAKQLFTYVKTLNANSVSLNFPFFQGSLTSNDPGAGVDTPSTSRLASIAKLAEGMGLQVQYRPYLDQTSLFPSWRGAILPTDPAQWFANYESFLSAYLTTARVAGVSSFVIGTELMGMIQYLNYWKPIVDKAHAVFGPNVGFAASRQPFHTLPGTQLGYDAYSPVHLSSDSEATVANLTSGIIANLSSAGFQASPSQTVIQEVGIAAAPGAYLTPWNGAELWGTPIVRSIQANWFAANCNAFWTLHMKGIYFWSLSLEAFSPNQDDSLQYLNWMSTSTATAIQSCFARSS